MDFLSRLDTHTLHMIAVGALAILCLAALWAALIPQLKLKRLKGEYARLRRECDARGQMLEKCRAVTKELLAGQPQAVVQALSEARRTHAPDGDAILTGWMAEQGESVGRILLYLAQWAYVRAEGADRPAGLAAAKSYAAAACCLAPGRSACLGFYKEISEICAASGAHVPDLPMSLRPQGGMPTPQGGTPTLQGGEPAPQAGMADLFDRNAEVSAEDAERQAEAQYAAGRNYLALASIDRALELHGAKEDVDPDLILNDQALEGYILLGLGRESEALALLHAVANAMAEDPLYGPDHPDTLACRYELARILADLGRRDEALTLITDVLERQLSSVDLGPEHPDTEESQKFLHSLREAPTG